MSRADPVYGLHGVRGISVAEVEQYRRLGNLLNEIQDHGAVIADRGQAEPRRREPAERAAPAIADRTHLSHPLQDRRCGRDIHERAVDSESRADGPTPGDSLLRIVQLHSLFGTVEDRRRDGTIPCFRKPVADPANVGVDPEDFLDHYQSAPWRSRGIGSVCVQGVAVFSGQDDRLAHGVFYSFLAPVSYSLTGPQRGRIMISPVSCEFHRAAGCSRHGGIGTA